MLTEIRRLSGRARWENTRWNPSDCGRRGISLGARAFAHASARRWLAACSLQLAAESPNWVNETLSPLTHVQTHARRRLQAHRLHAGVLYAQRARVSPLNFSSLRRQAPDVLTFYQGASRKLFPFLPAGISGYFCGRSNSVIFAFGGVVWPRVQARYTRLIDPSFVALTLLSRAYTRVMLPDWNNAFIFHCLSAITCIPCEMGTSRTLGVNKIYIIRNVMLGICWNSSRSTE